MTFVFSKFLQLCMLVRRGRSHPAYGSVCIYSIRAPACFSEVLNRAMGGGEREKKNATIKIVNIEQQINIDLNIGCWWLEAGLMAGGWRLVVDG